jgi:hypothetical protein
VKIGQSAGKSWEYLVGVFLGDGCVTYTGDRRYPVFRLNTIDEDFMQATKEALHDLTDRHVSVSKEAVKRSPRPNYALRCSDPEICALLKSQTDEKKKLPDWIWGADQDARLAFIAGLMDSEGYVSRQFGRRAGLFYMGFKSTDVWFDDFVRVLHMSGILTGKIGKEGPIKPHYRPSKRVTIKLASWVRSGAYFNIARKQVKVDEWLSQLTSEANTPDALFRPTRVGPRRVMIESDLR